jgi:hypothetical protein
MPIYCRDGTSDMDGTIQLSDLRSSEQSKRRWHALIYDEGSHRPLEENHTRKLTLGTIDGALGVERSRPPIKMGYSPSVGSSPPSPTESGLKSIFMYKGIHSSICPKACPAPYVNPQGTPWHVLDITTDANPIDIVEKWLCVHFSGVPYVAHKVCLQKQSFSYSAEDASPC